MISAAESRIPDWAAEDRGGNVPFCIRGSLKRIVGHFAGEDLFIGLVDCLLIHDTDPSILAAPSPLSNIARLRFLAQDPEASREARKR